MSQQLQHNYSFKNGIGKVLKQVHPDSNITGKTKESVNYLLHHVGEKIIKAANLANTNKTISSRDIQTGVRLVLPGELAKHAVSDATKALTKFSQGVGRGSKRSRSNKSGLIFSVSTAEHLIRRFNEGAHTDGGMGSPKWQLLRVGKNAPVYLAAVLEYLAAEILELGGNVSRENKKTNNNNRHVELGIKNDEELNKLFSGISFNGVVPYIHRAFLPKKKQKKNPWD